MATWRDIAAQLKPAEDQLIERYRFGQFKGDSAAPGRGYRVVETPWGVVGRRGYPGFAFTAVSRRSAWPETQAVFEIYWEEIPDRRFVVMQSIWRPGHWYDDGPPYDEFYDTHIAVNISKQGVRWMRSQPGPVVHMKWGDQADLDHPPADGEPPEELLLARREWEAIRNTWTSRG